jgi:hypothetical protein
MRKKSQRELQAAARKCFGTIEGGDPHGSENVRQEVRKRLHQRLQNSRKRTY